MEVILTETIPGTGKKHQLIKAKPGFALNYLLPFGKGVVATAKSKMQAEKMRSQMVMRMEELIANAEKIKTQIESKVYQIKAKVSEKGHLYGSIGEKEIAQLLEKEEKIAIDPKNIQLTVPIKELGEFEVKIRLTETLETVIKIQIAQE